MNTSVCVPYRGDDDGWRDRNWAFVRDWWERSGIGPISTGDRPGAFNRAAARNEAARAAGTWDVAVFADADTFMPDAQPILDAIALARGGGAVLPHDHYVALTSRGTSLLMRGDDWHGQTKYERVSAPLGIIVVSRAAWETVGGFDERWTDWGGEDVAFRIACSTLSTLTRLPGTLVHLWHPRDPAKSRYIASRGGPLRDAYRKADGDPAALRKLLEGT